MTKAERRWARLIRQIKGHDDEITKPKNIIDEINKIYKLKLSEQELDQLRTIEKAIKGGKK